MKKNLYPLLTFLFIAFVNVTDLSAQQINAKIQEVYGDKTQELVVNEPSRLSFLTDLIENRIKITESPLTLNDKFTKLSTTALFNKYNNAIARDITCDPASFNALKYDLKFSSKTTEIYRIDNTDYIIVIQPQILKEN